MAFLPTDERSTAVVEIYATHPDTIVERMLRVRQRRDSACKKSKRSIRTLGFRLRVKSYTRVGAQQQPEHHHQALL